MKDSKEKPEIELYMYSINQEFPVGTGHHTFLKRQSELAEDVAGGLVQVEQAAVQSYKDKAANNWSVQWIHNKWIQNYTKRAGSAYITGHPLERLILRREDFGGIILDPVNDRVFKLNEAGMVLMEKIIKAAQKTNLAKFRTTSFAAEDVRAFSNFLKGAGLWV